MSLTSADIAVTLSNGLYFSRGTREFSARIEPKSDSLIVNDLTILRRHTLPLESVLDAANADENGSSLEDESALKRLLGEFPWI
jgi:hypothetical protein